MVGRKPLDQLAAPPLMPVPVDITTKAGNSGLATQTVDHPRAQARPAGLREAGVEEDLRRR